MNEKDNIINLTDRIKPQEKVDDNFNVRAKNHTNPIMKKLLVINIRDNVKNKFKISDLFD